MDAAPRVAEAPNVLALQPAPKDCSVAKVTAFGRTLTAVARTWRPGDAALCRLCPRGACAVSDDGLCLVVYPRDVAEASAPLEPWSAGAEAGGGRHGPADGRLVV